MKQQEMYALRVITSNSMPGGSTYTFFSSPRKGELYLRVSSDMISCPVLLENYSQH